MKFELTILGSSSATPVFNRNPTAQLLNSNEKLYLIDCGEGTQQQLIRFGIKAAKISHIFISHLHGDHFFGLIGLLSSMHLNGRIKPMHLFCPPALKEIIELQLLHSDTQLRYEIVYHFIHHDQSRFVLDNSDLTVETIILNHRIPCTGFKFTEKKRQRKLITERVEQENIPIHFFSQLKKGMDITLPDGRHFKNVDLTIDSATPRKYAYCSDTLYDEKYFDTIKDVDTLYHEATFLHDMLARANETHHTTALQAGNIAKLVGAKQLIIGHYSSRYKTLEGFLTETSAVFANTQLAIEGHTYQL